MSHPDAALRATGVRHIYLISEHLLLCQNPESAKVSAYLLYLLSVSATAMWTSGRGCLGVWMSSRRGTKGAESCCTLITLERGTARPHLLQDATAAAGAQVGCLTLALFRRCQTMEGGTAERQRYFYARETKLLWDRRRRQRAVTSESTLSERLTLGVLFQRLK